MEKHEQTTAYFDREYTEVTKGASKTWRITYWFDVNGKRYRGEAKSPINPKYPRGIVFYNPENPEENELQPIPKEEEYLGDDRKK